MAYISNDDENPNTGSMNVFDPQGQGGGTPQGQLQGQPISVSGGESAVISGQAQAPAQQTAAPKGSGFFKDLRKYVSANQGQAPQLAQAVQKNVQSQAQQIGQQVQQQQQNFQKQIANNQTKLQQAQSFSQQALQKASQGQTPEQQEIQRFQQLAQGQERFDQTGTLGLSGQELATRNLQDLTRQAETATGANRLLRDTFGKQGPTYTKGQESLDALLMGRDKGSRQQVVGATQQAAKTAEQQIRDARQQALAQTVGLTQQGEQFRTGLQDELGQARTGVEQDIDALLKQKQDELVNKRTSFEQAVKEGKLTQDQLRQFLTPEQLTGLEADIEKSRQKALGRLYLTQGKRDLARQADVSDLDSLDYYDSRFGSGIYEADYLFDSPNRWDGYEGEASSFAQGVLKNLQNYGLTQNEVAQAQQNEKQAIMNRKDLSVGEQQALLNNVNASSIVNLLNKKSQDTLLNEFINKANQSKDVDSYKQFLSNVDESKLQREMFVTDDQIARQQALAALAGRVGENAIERKAPISNAGFDIAKARRLK